MAAIRDDADGALLHLRVRPRSQPAGLVGERDGRLLIRVGAAPVDGAANRAVRELLADRLDLPPSRLVLVSGDTHRDKVLRVTGLRAEEVARRLDQEGRSHA